MSKNIVVMNVSQARSGRVSMSQDPVSLRLFEHGVVSGVDMTTEAAYAKMVVYLSSLATQESQDIADRLQIEACGEQSQSIFHIHLPGKHTREAAEQSDDYAFEEYLRPERDVIGGDLLKANLDYVKYIQLRLLGVRPSDVNVPTNRNISMRATLVDENRSPSTFVIEVANDTLKWSGRGRLTNNFAYDLTEHRKMLLSRDKIPSTTLRIQTNEGIQWSKASIVVYASLVQRY